jgi:hypothetical protein
LIDGDENEAKEFSKNSGITKVIGDSNEDIRTYLW